MFRFFRRKEYPTNDCVVAVPVFGSDQVARDRAAAVALASNPASAMSRGIDPYGRPNAILAGDRGSGVHSWKGGSYVDGRPVTPQNFYSAVRPAARPFQPRVAPWGYLPSTGTQAGAGAGASSNQNPVGLMTQFQGSLGIGG